MAQGPSSSAERLGQLAKHFRSPPLEEDRVETSPFLQGNYRPVEREVAASGLRVVAGEIPRDLCGHFVRTGPNAFFDLTHRPYHYFDGDGMVHAIHLEKGTASYRNRWVRTKRLRKDQERGFSFSENGEMAHGNFDVLPLILDENRERMGKANTNMVHHAARLMALDEQDKPYLMSLPDLETVGRHDFEGRWRHSFTAHPKIDPETKEMVFFTYLLRKRGPWFYHGVADAQGRLIREVPVDIRGPTMIHDCAITRRFTIVMDMPARFSLQNLTAEGPWHYDPTSPSRFGLLPRHSVDGKDVRWFEFKGCFIYHTFNAWEEGDRVHLIACRSSRMTTAPSPMLNSPEDGTYPHEYIFDLRTGQGTERRLVPLSGDFPVIHPGLVGRKNRFFYYVMLAGRPGEAGSVFKHVVKYDRLHDQVLVHTLQEDMTCGEFVFVPRAGARNPLELREGEHEGQGEGEDDGYLVSFCHNEATNQSEFYIIDASTMADQPVARVALPQRVPWGFHGNWVPSSAV